jgi:hypothetical protein
MMHLNNIHSLYKNDFIFNLRIDRFEIVIRAETNFNRFLICFVKVKEQFKTFQCKFDFLGI